MPDSIVIICIIPLHSCVIPSFSNSRILEDASFKLQMLCSSSRLLLQQKLMFLVATSMPVPRNGSPLLLGLCRGSFETVCALPLAIGLKQTISERHSSCYSDLNRLPQLLLRGRFYNRVLGSKQNLFHTDHLITFTRKGCEDYECD